MNLPYPARRGVSIVEAIGCVAALAGGVVLGAVYLGLEPKQMAVASLRWTGLLEQGTVAAAPEASASAPSEIQPPTTTDGEGGALASTFPVADESAGQSADGQTAEGAPQEFSGPAAGLANALMTPEETVTLSETDLHRMTDEYWTALELSMQAEVDGRKVSPTDVGNWQLFDYLTLRRTGHEAAATAIGALPTRGVDPHVLAYAKRAQKWHEDGGRLFSRAVDLLTDAPGSRLTGPFAQSWQSAATQHRMESRLLEEKHTSVQAYLDHARQPDATPTSPPTAETAVN